MIGLLELTVFVGLSGLAVAASIHSWRAAEAYGTFRFLGFECIAILVGWNARRWFHDPLAPQQLASWILIAAATLLAGHGTVLLRGVGRAQRRVIEDTESLVEVRAYRYVRHPLYASLLLFGWAVFLKGVDVTSAVLAIAASGLWFGTARMEEQFNLERFGAKYAEYMKRTKMFIPYLL